MGKGINEFTVEGLEQLLVEFDDMALHAPLAAKKGVELAGKRLADAIKQNISTMLTLEYGTGALLDSVSYVAKSNDKAAFGSAGVYHMLDKIYSKYGLTNKDISRPQLAYWLENGIQPHSTAFGSRVRSKRYDHRNSNHPGVTPRPFISSAYEQNIAQIQQDLVTGFNQYHKDKGF